MENAAIQLLFILLPSKTEFIYKKLLIELKLLLAAMAPESILIDYEVAMMNAISNQFLDSVIRGCLFHRNQCIYRKIQQNGLKQKYDQDVKFALKRRYLPAVAFVPIANVVQAFEELLHYEFFPEEAQSIVD